MRRIKLSMVALAAFFTIGVASAQLGIQAGYSNQKSTTTGTVPVLGDYNVVTKTNGFYIGASYDLTVQGVFGLNYGLTYNYAFGKSETTKPTLLASSMDAVGHRLDLPFRIQAGIPMSDDIKLLAFAGPNFTMSLGQKIGDTQLADEKNSAGEKKMECI